MTKYRTISRSEAKPLIESGRLTPAGLYEPEHCVDGSEFVFVELLKGQVRFYRLRPER